MGHYLYLTPACYEKIYGEKPEYNCFLFTIRDGYSQKQKEDAGKKILARKEVLNVSYMHEIREQLDDMLKSLNLVIVVLIISAGMLAFVVLYNLNNINIAERQRELATLKVLGFYDQEVGAYVYRENLDPDAYRSGCRNWDRKDSASVYHPDSRSGCGNVRTQYQSAELSVQFPVYGTVFNHYKWCDVF